MDEFRRVLIVDDEFIIRQGIEFLIDWKNEGYELIAKCNNGLEALRIIENETVDIVISDIVMPQMDGIELTRHIHNKCPDTRVIILSSYSDFDYVKNTFQQGAVDYILKPTLSPETLLKALNEVSDSMPKKQIKRNVDIAHQLSRYVSGYKDALSMIDTEKFSAPYFYLLAANKRFDTKKDIDSFLNVKLEQEFEDRFYCVFTYLEDYSIVLFNCNDSQEII